MTIFDVDQIGDIFLELSISKPIMVTNLLLIFLKERSLLRLFHLKLIMDFKIESTYQQYELLWN